MVSGEAARRAELAPGSRYLALNKQNGPHWEPIWKGNPHMARPGEPHDGTIGFVNGTRAYIESLTKERYTFRAYEPHPSALVIPGRERLARAGHGFVVFNPTIKVRAPPNKQWPLEYWHRLIADNPGVRWLQVGDSGALIRGAERVITGNFVDALGVVSGALALVCHEGALHHGAAAVGVPTVVIRGGFISPRVTGYEGQTDLYVEDARYPLGCGMRNPCEHCKAAMRSISPKDVMSALRSVLREPVAA